MISYIAVATILFIGYRIFSVDSVERYDFRVIYKDGTETTVRGESFKEIFQLTKNGAKYPFAIKLHTYELKDVSEYVYDGSNYTLYEVATRKKTYSATNKTQLMKMICEDGVDSKIKEKFWVSGDAKKANKNIMIGEKYDSNS